jgi:hypothetical protein
MTFARLAALLVGLSVIAAADSADAQQTAKFAKIDCSTSRLLMPLNLICLASNEVAGGDFAGGSPGGVFKYWNAIGKVDGRKAYVYGVESIDTAAEIRISSTLGDAINSITPYPKPATNFSDLRKVADADVVSFTSGDGDACAAVRKVGPARQTGYRWVVFGLLCGPSGKTLADGELFSFISTVGFR